MRLGSEVAGWTGHRSGGVGVAVMSAGLFSRARIGTVLRLLALALALLLARSGRADPDQPVVVDPPAGVELETAEVYASVEVLAGEAFEVWLTADGQAPLDVTSAFRFASNVPPARQRQHAHLPVPVGSHELWVVQHRSAGSTLQSGIRSFSRAAGATVELGPLGDAGGAILGAPLVGALDRASGASWLLFGETTLSGPLLIPTAQATSLDVDASDGIDLTYYGEPGAIAPVLDLAPADPGDHDEEEVWLSAPFERGSDVFAFYVRVDRDASPPEKGVGLAKATGGALPFARLTFPPGGGYFDDAYSLFQPSALPALRGVVISGTYALLFVQRPGASGLPQDAEIVLARAPLSSVETPSSYEYWTEVGGARAWRTSATGWVPLFTNASAPSVSWNPIVARWLAVSTQEQGALPPYTVSAARSAVQVRAADDPRGPWSPPVTLWALPAAHSGGAGTTRDAVQLTGLDSGATVYLAATDASNPAAPPESRLYEVDLGLAGLPEGPIAPRIVTGSGSTTSNPTLVQGYASPGDTVALVVNGETQWLTATAAADGSFQLGAALLDGANAVQAVASRDGLASPPSNAITLTYANGIDHNVNTTAKLTISTNTVWTAGSGAPYLVTGTLTVSPGVYLVVQRGAAVRFQTTGSALLVKGDLRIEGTAAAPVKLGPNGVADPLSCTTPGGWAGIDVNNSAAGGTGTATIAHAQIGCAANGVEVMGDLATIRDSEIYNSQTNGIAVTSGGSATIERVVVQRASVGGNAGIHLSQAGQVAIADCTVRRTTSGVKMVQSSPTISGTLVELNTNGVHIQRQSNPTLTTSAIRSNTQRGVWVEGNFTAAQDPLPIVTGNDVHGNGTDLVAEKFGDTLRLVEASGNWWGSSVPSAIVAKISDATDSSGTSPPFARFTPFLGASIAAGGEPVPGQFLNGPISGALVPGAPYDVVGKLVVPSGAQSGLTVQAGTELRFLAGTGLEARGLLHVSGTTSAPVQLHAMESSPTSGSWNGILIEGSGATDSVVEGALIEHAHRGVWIKDTFATVRSSTLRDFGRSSGPGGSGAGVVVDGEGPPSTPPAGQPVPRSVVRSNAFAHGLGHVGFNSHGILVQRASPLVEDNEVRDADDGIRIEGPTNAGSTAIAPSVVGNLLEDNHDAGLWVQGHADPVVNGRNQIRSNASYGVYVTGQNDASKDPHPVVHENELGGNLGTTDVFAIAFGQPTSTVLDFERNWWGTASLAAIAGRVYDQSDSASAPAVGFAPPLDGPGGQPVPGQYLTGPMAPGATLAAGTYQAVGQVSVAAGQSLVIEAGARLEFLPGGGIRSAGVLDVRGAAGNEVVFAPPGASCAAGDWKGIVITATGGGSSIDHAQIRCAFRGVEVQSADASVTNSAISSFPEQVGGQDGAGVFVTGAASGTISGNQIQNGGSGQGAAIYLTNASPTIDGNVLEGAKRGIRLVASSPTVTANQIRSHSSEGILVERDSAPTITGGNLIELNGYYGVRVLGNNLEGDNPAPVIRGNRILGNASGAGEYELYANSFGNPAAHPLDATLDYWGSDSPSAIATGIYDASEAPASAPTVTFTPFLLADGTASAGNVLNGTLSASRSLAAGTSWDVVGDVTVPSGVTLAVAEGVTLRFVANAALVVQGTLDVNGTAAERAVFTSASASPPQATWDGIRITGGTSTLDFARIEYADRALDVRNAAVDVRDSQVYDFGRPGGAEAVGIYYESASGTIQDNWVEHRGSHGAFVAYGIQLYKAAPTVSGNTVKTADDGIVIQGPTTGAPIAPSITGNTVQGNARRGIWVRAKANPLIQGGNVVTANQWGVYVQGDGQAAHDPEPVVSGNDLVANTTFDYLATDFGDPPGPVLAAESNWWGAATVPLVAARVSDAGDSASTGRTVDFAPFLNASVGSGGTPVAGNYLAGTLAPGTTLATGTTYDATGPLRVAPGASLIVEAGAVLRFVAGGELRVQGALDVEGSSANRARFTSIAGSGPGDWRGIVIEPTGTGSALDYSRIEYAQTGVEVVGASVSVTNSEIVAFSQTGIELRSGASGTIQGNLIENGSDAATGIRLEESSPSIVGNTIRNNQIGIHVRFGSNPSVTGGNTITSNQEGIFLEGGHKWNEPVRPNPAPLVHGNDISGNGPPGGGARNLHVSDFFFPGIAGTLDLRQNYWGSTAPSTIRGGFFLEDVPSTAVDFSQFLDAPGGSPTSGEHFSNTLTNVRHSTASFRPGFGENVGVSFDLLAPGAVDLLICDEEDTSCATPIRQQTVSLGSGPHTLTWDGRDGLGSYQKDGAYKYVLRVDGGTSGNYDPVRPSGPPKGEVTAGAAPPQFNAYRNEWWKREITVSGDTRKMRLVVSPEGQPPFLAFDHVCLAPSAAPYTLAWNGLAGSAGSWNGSAPSGPPVSGRVYLDLMEMSSNLVPNHFVLAEVAPGVRGASSGPAPTVEVRSNPALVYHSYDQLTSLTYELDRAATVTVKLLPPGVTDPDAPAAIVVLAPVAQAAGPHTVTWGGHDGVDTNAILASQEGTYQFVIQATGSSTGATSLYRSVVVLRQ